MFGIQIAICFAMWLGFGYFVFRNRLILSLPAITKRGKRVALATLILVGSGIALLGSLLGLQSMGGIVDGSLTILAWLGAIVVGSIFVGLQVLAIDLLLGIVCETVTPVAPASSDRKEGSSE